MKIIQIDCRDVNCPMPIVRAARALRNLHIGDVIEVATLDPAFDIDIKAWIERSGHILESYQVNDDSRIATIKKVR